MYNNHITITLKIDKVAGILGHVTALIIEQGMRYEKHRQETQNGENLLGLNAEGIVQGLLNTSTLLPKSCVKRAYCCAAGHSVCAFKIEPIKLGK